MFTYLDAEPHRPSLEEVSAHTGHCEGFGPTFQPLPTTFQVMDDYWRLMPQYQSVDLDSIDFKRVLFGYFPTYRESPLAPGFDR